MIKIQWLASICVQNDQNVELRRETFKTTQNYKTDQITMNCIDWMSKRSKQRKTTKVIKLPWLASILRQNDKNVELRRKTFKTTHNYKTNQITMNCIDWMSKRSKQRKTTKVIKLPWLASIICQNDQNKAKLQKWSKSNDLHRFDVKTIKKCSVTSQNIQNYAKLQNRSNYIELHRLDGKTIKTKLNYKSDQNPMTCIDLRSKRSKCRVTSRNIQNNAKLQNRSNYNELHRLDVKTIKTTQNYKSNQITMTCIDYMSKRSKQS